MQGCRTLWRADEMMISGVVKEIEFVNKYAFGVDIGGTTIKLGLFDGEGNILDKWEIPTSKSVDGTQILPDIAVAIEVKLQEKEIEKSEVIGVGVGVPGPVDSKGTIYGADNLGWGVFNVAEILSSLISLPVKVGNDANVAAFGEMWKGGGEGYNNLVMVTLGTGVGGGIIVGGNIVSGYAGGGGEVGHIHIEDGEEEPCGCGNYGCLEQYASATGIVRLAKRRLMKDDAPSRLRSRKLSAKSVFDAVKAGDEVAMEIADEFGRYLGKGLAVIASVVNPEVFVIGGGVSKAGEILFDYIRPYFLKYAYRVCKDTKFVLATLANDAGICGAAGLILNNDK